MKRTENKYVKRTQKDYPMSFKLSVVREYEETKAGLRELTRKYGIQGHDTFLFPSKVFIYGKHDPMAEEQLDRFGFDYRVYADVHRRTKSKEVCHG